MSRGMALDSTFDSSQRPFGLGKPLRVLIIARSTEEARGGRYFSKERNNPPGKPGAFNGGGWAALGFVVAWRKRIRQS